MGLRPEPHSGSTAQWYTGPSQRSQDAARQPYLSQITQSSPFTGNFGGVPCPCRSFPVRDKTKKLFLLLSTKGLEVEHSFLPEALGGPFPGGDGFPPGPAFCIHPLSSRPWSTGSVALRIGDLTIRCHRDHCDVTSRGQVVQGGVEGGSAWLELRDIRGFCPIFMPRKGSVWSWILIPEADLATFPWVLLRRRDL